ncbi:MAG: prolipoprotein diacylglyceryl transferase [Oscillospiraceae bacterium]|nr:prolipoprotein diacylglyceryl transferase [Oscillospiraceae bacterium]
MDTISFPNLFGGEVNVDRVAFSIFGLNIYWYGLLITTGMVCAFLYVLRRVKSFGLESNKFFDVVFVGGIAGIIGARLFYVLFSDKHFTLREAVFGIRDGGLAIYGGIIFSLAAGVICAKIFKIRVLPVLDLAGLGFLIGQSIGRWGNFFNQEAFGAVTSPNYIFGMTGNIISQNSIVKEAQAALAPGETALVHPCFLYESLWCALGFLLLHFYSKKRTFDGEIFLLYVAWYGLGRSFIETLRIDSLYAGQLKISQLIAVITSAAAVAVFIYFKKNSKTP